MNDAIECEICRTLEDIDSRREYRMWREPLFAYVAADESALQELKSSVSKSHLLPTDILPDAKSIVAFFIPFSAEVEESNRDGRHASALWAESYIATNEAIREIGNNVERLLSDNGYAVGKIPATHNFDEKTLISDWSHRHIAQIAGLGSFGINNMLITDSGCCGRVGTLIANCELTPTAIRTQERCLSKLKGTCGVCRRRCVTNAFRDSGFDRQRCYGMCLENAALRRATGYADVCGKCVVGIPCALNEPNP
jgi:epoxyqueuosine reductase QueG